MKINCNYPLTNGINFNSIERVLLLYTINQKYNIKSNFWFLSIGIFIIIYIEKEVEKILQKKVYSIMLVCKSIFHDK